MTTRQFASVPRALLLVAALAAVLLVAPSGGASAAAADAGPAVAAAETKRCRNGLYPSTGISDVTARNMPCARAVRVLRNWAGNDMPSRGPRGWSCRIRRHGGVAPYTRARCARNRARLRFMIGG